MIVTVLIDIIIFHIVLWLYFAFGVLLLDWIKNGHKPTLQDILDSLAWPKTLWDET